MSALELHSHTVADFNFFCIRHCSTLNLKVPSCILVMRRFPRFSSVCSESPLSFCCPVYPTAVRGVNGRRRHLRRVENKSVYYWETNTKARAKTKQTSSQVTGAENRPFLNVLQTREKKTNKPRPLSRPQRTLLATC